jgi:ribosomal protein L29
MKNNFEQKDNNFRVKEKKNKKEIDKEINFENQQKLLAVLKIKGNFSFNNSLTSKLKRNIARIKTLKNTNKDKN